MLVDLEGSRCTQVTLGQLGIFESSVDALNPVIHRLVRGSHVLYGVGRESEHELVAVRNSRFDDFDLTVEHTTCQIQVSTFVTSRVAFAGFTDVSTSGDVGIFLDGLSDCVAHCLGDCQVVVGVTSDVCLGHSDGNAQPCTIR